jgi:hypothetical protein
VDQPFISLLRDILGDTSHGNGGLFAVVSGHGTSTHLAVCVMLMHVLRPRRRVVRDRPRGRELDRLLRQEQRLRRLRQVRVLSYSSGALG